MVTSTAGNTKISASATAVMAQLDGSKNKAMARQQFEKQQNAGMQR